MWRHTKCTLLALLWLLLLTTGVAHSAVWQQTGSLNLARDQFAAAVVGDKLYAFGGNGDPDGVNLSSLEIYDTDTGVWTLGPSNVQGVEELSGAAMGGRFFVFGAWGGGTPFGVFNFVEEFDPTTQQWRSLAAKPTTVSAAPAVVYGGEIFLFGGIYTNEQQSEPVWYSVVEAFNPATNTWRGVTQMPVALQNMAVAVHGDMAYFFGGVYAEQGQLSVQTDVIAYHFPSDTWVTSGLGVLPSIRIYGYQSAAPIVNGRVFLVGGYGLIDPDGPLSETNVGPVVDVWVYDVATGQFTEGTSLPEPRDDSAVLFHDGYLYAISGQVASGRTGETLRLRIAESTGGTPVPVPALEPAVQMALALLLLLTGRVLLSRRTHNYA